MFNSMSIYLKKKQKKKKNLKNDGMCDFIFIVQDWRPVLPNRFFLLW